MEPMTLDTGIEMDGHVLPPPFHFTYHPASSCCLISCLAKLASKQCQQHWAWALIAAMLSLLG